MGAASVEFVGVPLDTVLAYYYRAKKCTLPLPAGRRLAWLQAKDTEERSEWVTRFRESTDSLGLVIKQVMEARDARWTVSSPTPGHAVLEQPAASAANKEQLVIPGQSKFREGPMVAGKKTAAVLKDGTRLCTDFHRQAMVRLHAGFPRSHEGALRGVRGH